MQKTLYLVSLGCTKNLIDSEVMLGRLKEYKICDDVKSADVIIVNTCGFIDAAKTESINTILMLHDKRREDSLLVVSGCLSERYKEELQKEIPEVDIFTGVGDYDKIDELIAKKESRFSAKTYLVKNEKRVISNSTYHAYIKLSEGCNQQCSFCAIPKFKGKLQSRELYMIEDEVKELVKMGYYDFSFISQDSSSYLRDFNIDDGLIHLIKTIEKIDGVKSARILYLYPSTLSIDVIKEIQNSKIFHNYFDIPLQHISNRMLKIMKRGLNKDGILKQLKLMRGSDDAFLRTSVIVGHPGEKDEDFDELCQFFKDIAFDRVSIFSYSDEEETASNMMDDKVPQKVIDKRIKLLNKIIQKQITKSLKQEIDKVIKIVAISLSAEHEYFVSAKKLNWAEEIDGEILINENLLDEPIEFGQTYEAKITDIAGDKLIATVIRKC